jgi:hypothetical protein
MQCDAIAHKKQLFTFACLSAAETWANETNGKQAGEKESDFHGWGEVTTEHLFFVKNALAHLCSRLHEKASFFS